MTLKAEMLPFEVAGKPDRRAWQVFEDNEKVGCYTVHKNQDESYVLALHEEIEGTEQQRVINKLRNENALLRRYLDIAPESANDSQGDSPPLRRARFRGPHHPRREVTR